MTLRAIDGLRVDLSGDLNEGLDALEEQPSLAVRGPFVKSKVGRLLSPERLLVHKEYFTNRELVHEVGPFKYLVYPILWIPCPGMPSGYWKLQSSTVEQIWWFRTPPEFRPPVYRSLEELEARALRNYERRVQRRIDQWSYDVENDYQKFVMWKYRKLHNLDRAMTRIRNKRRISLDDQRRLVEIQKKYSNVLQKEFTTHLAFDPKEFSDYKAKYLDIWEHKYACERRRWLATPKRVLMLPVWHIRVNNGFAFATLDQQLEQATIDSMGAYSGGFSYRIRDYRDLSVQAPTSLFEKEIPYDVDALLDAVNDMLPKVKPATNIIVTAVELREFGNLFTEAKSLLAELKKAIDLLPRSAKTIRSLIRAGAAFNRLQTDADVLRFFKSKMWDVVKKDAVRSAKGCLEAAQFLSCKHLAYRFGDPDSVRALEELWDIFHKDFERLMKPLYDALATAGNTASRHRTILEQSESFETKIECPWLFRDDQSHDSDDEHPDPSTDDELEPWLLAPTGPILKLVQTQRRQTATLVTQDVLVDTFGNQVGVDEAVTRYIMDLVGLNFNPKTIWDLSRYTFVIDWFLNVGQILEDYCSVSNLRFKSTILGGCVSEKFNYITSWVKSGQSHTSHYEELWRDSDNSYEYIQVSNDVGLLTRPLAVKLYRRNPVPASVLEQGRLRFHWDDYLFKGIGASQMLCGVELLMQRIRS